MNDFIYIAQIVALVWAIIALAGLVWFSRWLDKRAGTPFGEALARMGEDPRALGIYYGLRWLGCAIVVGAALY